MRTALAVLVLSAIALAYYNPEMEDFQRFVEVQSERILHEELGDGALGQALSGAGSELAARYVERVTERDGYGVFSVYTIDLGDEDDDWRFLGIAGRFIELDRPASLDERPESP